jgi:hypothetical protein
MKRDTRYSATMQRRNKDHIVALLQLVVQLEEKIYKVKIEQDALSDPVQAQPFTFFNYFLKV